MSESKKEPKQAQEKQQQVFLIGENLLQGIANFLGNQKYVEVAGLIEGLKHVQPVNVSPEPEAKKPAPRKRKLKDKPEE